MTTDAAAGDQSSGSYLRDLDSRRSIFADSDGVIRAWGSAWVETFGYSESEALGQSLDLIVPKALQPLHWRGFTRAMRTGKLKRPEATLKVPAVHKDGSVIPVRFVDGTLIAGQDGQTNGIRLAFARRDPAWVGLLYRVMLALLTYGQRVWHAIIRSRAASRSS